MTERTIIHSDLNCFFASVEMMLNPSLKGKPMAVCGSTEDRHGIILAKSWEAKSAGVKTGMPNWQAKKCCQDIILVPPQYNEYLKYSKKVRAIYDRFTDQVEPYGIDECWLDVTGSGIYGTGLEIAHKIKSSIKNELDLTVSMGVSYNKIFAKLGSDVNIPDNIRVITKDSFKNEAWNLPVKELIFVGRATAKKLNSYGINTIGQLARSSPVFIKKLLGKNGIMIWKYANGLDDSPVNSFDFVYPAKSVSHGITLTEDLFEYEEIKRIILFLSQDVSLQLHTLNLSASGINISVRNSDLYYFSYQAPLDISTQSFKIIADACFRLFVNNYTNLSKGIRSITVGAFKLKKISTPLQLSLFPDDTEINHEKIIKLDTAVDEIKRRYGNNSIKPLSLLNESKLPSTMSHLGMPHPINR